MIRNPVFTLVLASLFIAVPGSTKAQQATPEQCTCHSDEKRPAPEHRADVVNATLCVQSRISPRRLCKISVHELDRAIGQRLFSQKIFNLAIDPATFERELGSVRAGRISSANEIFSGLLRVHQEFSRDPKSQEDIASIERLNRKYSQKLFLCLYAFSRGTAISQVDEGFQCRVYQENGWLVLLYHDLPGSE